jgi:hypothetical protein
MPNRFFDWSGRSLVMGFVIAAWLGLVATGFAFWERYDGTPGQANHADSLPVPTCGGWELVLFAHPHCPCTRASLGELAELAHQAGPNLAIRVVFVRPNDAPKGWERSESWNLAEAIPGVRVSCDPDGSEAQRSGARTSGHLVVYDPQGRVAFYGGITRGRGRVGESVGRQAVLDLLVGKEPAIRETPVFGCALFNSDACHDREKATPCQQ